MDEAVLLPGRAQEDRARLFRRSWAVVVCADGDTVLGTRAADHDLRALHGPLRSHGGLAEREVPMLFNRPLEHAMNGRPKNYDAFWVGLNLLALA